MGLCFKVPMLWELSFTQASPSIVSLLKKHHLLRKHPPWQRGVYPVMWIDSGLKICTDGVPNMEVSWNRGTPKSSILVGCSIINHPFWGSPIYGNPICSGIKNPKLNPYFMAQTLGQSLTLPTLLSPRNRQHERHHPASSACCTLGVFLRTVDVSPCQQAEHLLPKHGHVGDFLGEISTL